MFKCSLVLNNYNFTLVGFDKPLFHVDSADIFVASCHVSKYHNGERLKFELLRAVGCM